MPIEVEILNAPDRACDEFVLGRPEGKACFLPAWSFMAAKLFGYRSLYLVARQGGRVVGVLPLLQVRSWLFGNRMVSQAFADYGGILSDSWEARDALFARAVELATEAKCESMEFRNAAPLPYDLVGREGKASMRLALGDDPEALWTGFKAKVRNQVRKARKSDITACVGGLELLDDFYRVYTHRMHQLGTPAYARSLMAGLLEALPDNSRLFVVRLNDKLTVGGGITTYTGNYAEMLFAATLTQYNRLCPNNLLYWTVIEHYCRQGVRYFDFGRGTIGGGTYQFKKQWGSEQVNLHYQFWVAEGRELADRSPDSPRYRRKVAIWKKLPLWLTRMIGPRISRGLP